MRSYAWRRNKPRTCVVCADQFIGDAFAVACPSCWLERDRIRQRAVHAVQKAIKAGHLAKPTTFPCADCGKPATAYDHRDYTRPLAVEPVCARCNSHRGVAVYRHEYL